MADLTHDAIWDAIDRLAASRGWSASGLARRAGLDATSFNPSKRIGLNRKPRWPSTESVSLALKAADCSLDEFLGLMGELPATNAPLGTDYEMKPDDADFIAGIVGLNQELRSSFLAEYTNRNGVTGIVELFSQFIGMSNSAVAQKEKSA